MPPRTSARSRANSTHRVPRSACARWTLIAPLACTASLAHASDVEGTATLPQTALGWTDLQPSADSRLVYVSSSRGDDAFDGLSPQSAKRTIAAGKALLRNGRPDWLLLARGDVWHEPIGHWIACGRSPLEPAVIASYGDAAQRPLLLTGSLDGVIGLATGPSPSVLHNIAVTGLHFRADTYDGTNGAPAGIAWLIQADGLLVEDCEFERYQINVSIPGFGGRKHDVRLRRNVIVDAFAASGTVGHGVYLANCDAVLIEENVVDHNGWNESVPNALPSVFRHGIYVQGGSGACTGVVVRGNIVANSASHGLQLRPGGVADDNLFLRNPIAISLGGGNEPDPGGVRAVARGNVVLEGRDIDDQNHRGWGIDLANVGAGVVSDNIIAQQGDSNSPIAMDLYGDVNGIGVHDTLIARNIVWDWGGPLIVHGSVGQITGVTLLENAFNNGINFDRLLSHRDPSSAFGVTSIGNRFAASAAPDAWMSAGMSTYSLPDWKRLVNDTSSTRLLPGTYPDPGRTLASYVASLGGLASYATFMREARAQSRANWRQEYTAQAVIDYVRAGFGLGPR